MSWTPFEEIIRGNIVEALYAADLWSVYMNRASERYQDPNKFFERTYFTSSLRQFLAEASRRLSGDPNATPVFLLLTGLGGGKTHSLIALYHLAKNWKVLSPETRGVLEKEGIKMPDDVEPIVVVFDGSQLDPSLMEREYGSKKLWGYVFEILYRTSNNEEFKKAKEDYKDVVPGAERLYRLLKDLDATRPVLFLIDETLNYLKNLDDVERGKAAMFIQHLSVAVAQLKRSILVVTLLDTDEGRDVANRFVQNLQRVSRNESVITQIELPAVVRRALLSTVSSADMAAKALYERYNSYGSTFAQRYTADQLERYYPVHPATISLLTRLSENGAIQSTRDVLRILAWTLHEVYKEGRNGAFITPGDIPIERAEIRTLIFKDGRLRLAVEQDLADLKNLEEALGPGNECAKVLRRVYRAVALASAAESYLNEREAVTYSYSPDIGVSPVTIPTCLKEILIGNITHLHSFTRENITYYVVKSKAFWRALLRRKVEELLREKQDQFYNQLKRHIQSTNIIRIPDFQKAVWDNPPDEPGPIIVLADPRWQNVEEVIEYTKDRKPRIMRGAVIVLKPDEKETEKAIRILAEMEGAREIRERAREYGLEEVDIKEIDGYIQNKTRELKDVVTRGMYTFIVYAKGDGGYSKLPVDLNLNDSPDDLYRKLVDTLKGDGKLAESINPEYLKNFVEKLYQTFKTPPTFKELIEYFGGKALENPLLLRPEEALKRAVKSGEFVIIRGNMPLQVIDYIDYNDRIAVHEIVRAMGLELPTVKKQGGEAAGAIIDVNMPQGVERAIREVSASSVKELVEGLKKLQSANVEIVRITLDGEVKEPKETRNIDDLLSFLDLYIKKVFEAGSTASRLKATLTVYKESEGAGDEIAKFEADIRRGQRDVFSKAVDVFKSIVKTYSSISQLNFKYSLEAQGSVSKLIQQLDTPLLVERFAKLKIRARLEEGINSG